MHPLGRIARFSHPTRVKETLMDALMPATAAIPHVCWDGESFLKDGVTPDPKKRCYWHSVNGNRVQDATFGHADDGVTRQGRPSSWLATARKMRAMYRPFTASEAEQDRRITR